jgi:succinoglycan biosynthesis protein ExoA
MSKMSRLEEETSGSLLPLVSVIMPIRNEEKHIGEAVSAVINQTYPRDKIEIIVVDGMSDDRTREIIGGLMDRAAVTILDNPKRIVPHGLNIGIRRASGSIIARIDGHAVMAPDYIEQCVETLNRTQAACVGGRIKSVNATFVGKVIAQAMSSTFGVGNSAFRTSDFEGYVDTLAFPSYPASIFERTGLFDEEFVRCQDDEFNFRLRELGGRIYLTPRIQSLYYPRTSVKKLLKQYYQYGYWKVRVMQRHPHMMQWRHFVPSVFVASLATSAFVSLIWSPMWWGFLGIVTAYVLASFAMSLRIAIKTDIRYSVLLPIVFACLHFGYGTGLLVGLATFAGRWREA